MLFFLIVFASSLANAELNPTTENDKSVSVTRQKITCISDMLSKDYDEQGKFLGKTTRKGKTSESIRTTWSEGDSELRSSESSIFSDDGTAITTSHSLIKFSKKKLENGLVVESSEMHSFTKYQGPYTGKDGQRLVESKSLSEDTFKVDGTQRILIKSVVDGKESRITSVESESRISDTVKEIKFVETTPYVDQGDWGMSEVLKSEMTCRFEILN